MRNRPIGGRLLLLLGLFLLGAALLLLSKNRWEEFQAGQQAGQILSLLQQQMAASASPSSPVPEGALSSGTAGEALEIQGNAFIGVLEIPALHLALPVMDSWSDPKLAISPCRYSGSPDSGGFTIAGHNYHTHFGRLSALSPGAAVHFTSIGGETRRYAVQAVEILDPTEVKKMIADQWDLTLFTCTLSGQARVAIRCLQTG